MVRVPLLLLPLAACSSLADPGYAPPTDQEAWAAYRTGQLADADLLAETMRQNPPTGAIEQFDRSSELAALSDPDMAKALTVGSCAWEMVDHSDLTESSRTRIGSAEMAGYRCDGVLKLSAWGLGTLPAPLKGYFFRDAAQQWVFAEVE